MVQGVTGGKNQRILVDLGQMWRQILVFILKLLVATWRVKRIKIEPFHVDGSQLGIEQFQDFALDFESCEHDVKGVVTGEKDGCEDKDLYEDLRSNVPVTPAKRFAHLTL